MGELKMFHISLMKAIDFGIGYDWEYKIFHISIGVLSLWIVFNANKLGFDFINHYAKPISYSERTEENL